MPKEKRDQSSPTSSSPAVEWLLRILCAVMLIGHGLMCWNGQMPLRALLWDEELVSGTVEKVFGMDWGTWVSSLEVDDGITRAIRGQAFIFFGFAFAALVPFWRRAMGFVYVVASLNLIFLAWLKYHDHGMGIGQLLEHAGQFLLPLVLALCV